MILGYSELLQRHSEIIKTEADVELINPASIDIRIGEHLLAEEFGGMIDIDLTEYNKEFPYYIKPGEFVLVSTYEHIYVPIDLAMELKLKSSRAREGYNHSLAFWVDPNWDGILTMEIQNVKKYTQLPLYPGMRFAQIILHQLASPCSKPYNGRYQQASSAEDASKLPLGTVTQCT
jgi:dCTP deaminase